ncbi:hypothetical protein PHLGIDRAFT_284756 [Phlebiopsis gigantea 11061_1 CR5-6]|uniref:Uncharacterized protein n=1 Tax=Phlebiopsis gigantea (strain 11061_1 CR5-6) TaxID=745531 RepID=A0A0C3RRG1_PHLG1|nr:hypothetical protein PHLGIDRAFT_284756 [Phlebiopsis gigantea 11061_1 CR5-6]
MRWTTTASRSTSPRSRMPTADGLYSACTEPNTLVDVAILKSAMVISRRMGLGSSLNNVSPQQSINCTRYARTTERGGRVRVRRPRRPCVFFGHRVASTRLYSGGHAPRGVAPTGSYPDFSTHSHVLDYTVVPASTTVWSRDRQPSMKRIWPRRRHTMMSIERFEAQVAT